MKKTTTLLGVNIDHIATLRQARLTRYPDPVEAVFAAESGGADGITVHLREDRRHIQERDVELIQAVLTTRLNLEMAVTDSMLHYAEKIKPVYCCLVPENRKELTTEGGLDVKAHEAQIKTFVSHLTKLGIGVSLFIDPDEKQIEAAARVEAPIIEIHTGTYAEAKTEIDQQMELKRIAQAARFAHQAQLIVNAGHGLHYHNVARVASLPEIHELNIGHAIIARALFCGLERAVSEMKILITNQKMGVFYE